MKKWLKYLLLFIPFVLKNIACWICAVPAVMFFSTPDRRLLTYPFVWLNSVADTDMAGDEYWHQHLIGTDPLSLINRIHWIFRNGGQYLAYGFFGCDVNDPHPFYRPYIPLAFGWRLDVMIGWNMKGAKLGRAKYSFTIRGKKGDSVEFDEGWND